MTTMLERAARAMFVGGVEHISDGDGWDDLPELFKNMMATKVRAVLMAVRGGQIELNDGMGDVYRAGFEAMFDAKFKDEYPMMSCGWEAMVDTILNEENK